MAKLKVSAREAVADIRSGMSDIGLMAKYDLTSEGLWSLFDKLVSAGYLDVAEMYARKGTFDGTVAIPQADLELAKSFSERRSHATKGRKHLISAQEAAKDIRFGMSDAAIMEKYSLSKRGLQSLFTKLIGRGIITRAELDRRISADDQTVDLREQRPTVSQVMRQMEKDEKAANGRAVGKIVDLASGEAAEGSIGYATPPKNRQQAAASEPERDMAATEQALSKGTSILIMASFGLLMLFVAIWFLVISWMK